MELMAPEVKMLSGRVTTPMKMPMMVVSTMEISSAPLIFTRRP